MPEPMGLPLAPMMNEPVNVRPLLRVPSGADAVKAPIAERFPVTVRAPRVALVIVPLTFSTPLFVTVKLIGCPDPMNPPLIVPLKVPAKRLFVPLKFAVIFELVRAPLSDNLMAFKYVEPVAVVVSPFVVFFNTTENVLSPDAAVAPTKMPTESVAPAAMLMAPFPLTEISKDPVC